MASLTTSIAVYPMPPPTADLDATLSFLNEGVDHIMTRLETGLSFAKYTALYTVAYNYCTANEMQGNLESNIAGTVPVGSDLYYKLTTYYVAHFKTIIKKSESLQDEDFLRYYAAEWDRYTIGANYLNRLFTYLNRYWVKHMRDEGEKNVYPVYTLALLQWKAQFLLHIQKDHTKLTVAVLRLITSQRNGDVIDQGLLKKVVDSFVSLGLDNADPNQECLDVYEAHFEAPFIDATEKYYKQESESFLAEKTVSNYLKKVEDRLREEEDRIERYVHTKTRKELISKCEHVLIREHSEMMWGSFQSLLDFDQDEDLRRMYAMLSRIPESLEPLRKIFESHVRRAGLSAISELVREGGANVDALEPKAYVHALLEIHHKNSGIITRSFEGEAGFVASLDKACREFVNRNAVTGTLSTRSSELIAKYADMLLRKDIKVAEDDLEGALNRVMVLFKYLEDKDAFQTFYTTKLSKRLVHGVSTSDEGEASMISKLKEACGFEYTIRLQRMFTDMSLSKNLTDSFMSQNHGNMDINFRIMVLGTNIWPLNPPNHDFAIPTEIVPTYDRFQKYYQTNYSSRKLTWLWNYSTNELRTNYLGQKYILMTTSYQMAVLLQYNRNDTLSLKELVAAIAIPKDILSQVLVLLVEAKILINNEKEQYDLNPNFKSNKIRINLIKANVKTETSYVLKTVDIERKHAIDVAVFRIIKARKSMKTQALIQEVISQISERFVPRIPDIKKAIETLLDKEYIERVGGQRDMLAYVV